MECRISTPWPVDASQTRLATTAQADIALLLPVRVEPEGEASWIRFGAMELIAERLRAAGQPMVPSATAIALAQELPEVPQRQDLARLSSGTGARHVLAARARRVDARWQVSIRSVDGLEPPITARGKAADVLVAARRAADETARALGLTPSLRPDAAPNVMRLLRRTDAAMLAQRLDLARELIATADPKLRRHPEVRLRLAWIEYSLFDLDAARDIFESLRADPAVRRDPVLYARTLHGLGGIYFQDGDQGAATVATEVVDDLSAASDPHTDHYLGRAWRIVLHARLASGNVETASEIAAAMRRWAEGRPTRGPKIYTAIAAAEVAAARHQTKAAHAAFEEALELADGGFVPLHLLQVAEAYLPWLLEQETDAARSDRALLIADRVAGYAAHDFAAALVQLRVYQALGPPSAWRSALNRADELAGERDMPPRLLAEPPPTTWAAR